MAEQNLAHLASSSAEVMRRVTSAVAGKMLVLLVFVVAAAACGDHSSPDRVPSETARSSCAGEGAAADPCEPRDIGGMVLSWTNPGAVGYESDDDAASVEDVLEKGRNLSGTSPVHIAFRGTGEEDSVRCDWRAVARTTEQRETLIRFWLGLGAGAALPSVAELEQQFMAHVAEVGIVWRDTMAASFMALARGGSTTDYVFLTCYATFDVTEYLLSDGPTSLTVAYDPMGQAMSYGLYRRSHETGRFGDVALKTEGEYEAFLDELVWTEESALREIVEGREVIIFLAPLGAHYAIAVEVWQVVEQWDLQEDDQATVHAVRFETDEGDPEHTQTLANLKTRITTAAADDDFADDRIENVDELDDYYDEIGAYDDITPDDGDTTTFTPAQPPPVASCANGTAVPDPATNLPLVHDCEALIDAKDTLRGTATLDWSTSSAITGWEGIATGGTPTRVTALELSSESLDGTIPAELAGC